LSPTTAWTVTGLRSAVRRRFTIRCRLTSRLLPRRSHSCPGYRRSAGNASSALPAELDDLVRCHAVTASPGGRERFVAERCLGIGDSPVVSPLLEVVG